MVARSAPPQCASAGSIASALALRRPPLRKRLSVTAVIAASRMPLCSRGSSACGICWKNFGATIGIMPAPTDSATM